jgi:hypothetical protein
MEMFIRSRSAAACVGGWGLCTCSISEYAFILYVKEVLDEFGCVTDAWCGFIVDTSHCCRDYFTFIIRYYL